PIPPLALPGDYFLDQIRLVKDGQTVLEGTPNVVPIKVISEIFVTSVTSRPLSLDEIRSKGIVIDDNNFDAFDFQLVLNIDNVPFTINLPVALPSRDLLSSQSRSTEKVKLLADINRELAERTEITLPPEFDRPGLNFAIAALPFVPVELDDGGRAFGAPPITGLVIIPGNIAFLNQFFSVLLTVANVAPDGSNLVLNDVAAEIILPLGADRQAGAFDDPGDDPLRLARIEGVGTQPVIQVAQSGTDGALGTADDIPRIAPQQMGEGEFLVEGLREGSHTVNISINAVLEGLPSGPVELIGEAVGAVFVRNPTFDITLSHPRTVRTGELYDLYATITNTSETPANLVSVTLPENSISGARLCDDDNLCPGNSGTVLFETLLSGESETAKFTLVAQQTGEVTFTSFTSEPGVTGRFNLRTGIGERDVPLAPNAIVLPATADLL
ncbi:MAG: hypothetical protein ACRDIB_14735, partial [Ardenticatenaceae bacterium]